MSDKTGWMPTTEQVREGYSIDPEDEYRDPINAPANRRANERYFDRWLAERIREAKAEAFEEGANAFAWAEANGDSPAHYVVEHNPYRSGTTTEGTDN